MDNLTASGRGQDKQGRRRSVAIPPKQVSWEYASKMRQHVATCDNIWQNVATRARAESEILQTV